MEINTLQCALLFLFLWVISPYAVVEGCGEAQPGQIGSEEQGGGAADGIPRHHGGSNRPREKNDLHQGLNYTGGGHLIDWTGLQTLITLYMY